MKNFNINLFLLAFRFAKTEIKTKYRRSLMGPLWISINMFISIFALGFVFSNLFGVKMKDYLPYVFCGLFLWNYISQTITDSVNLYVNIAIKNYNFPVFFFPLKLTFLNLIIGFHNFFIYFFLVIFINSEILNINFFYFLIAIPFYIINSFLISFSIGILSLRYRDLGQIILNSIYLIFLITPVFWDPKILSEKKFFIASFNPFYHFISIGREPLLGNPPLLASYFFVLLITIINIFITFIVYKTNHSNKAFWI
jgi:ABC-2 type transport system permease protein/lipopolysaccharide transport system permease protein